MFLNEDRLCVERDGTLYDAVNGSPCGAAELEPCKLVYHRFSAVPGGALHCLDEVGNWSLLDLKSIDQLRNETEFGRLDLGDLFYAGPGGGLGIKLNQTAAWVNGGVASVASDAVVCRHRQGVSYCALGEGDVFLLGYERYIHISERRCRSLATGKLVAIHPLCRVYVLGIDTEPVSYTYEPTKGCYMRNTLTFNEPVNRQEVIEQCSA